MVRRFHLLRAFAFAWLMTFAFSCLGAGRPVVWLALSETGGAYTEAAEAARAEIVRSGNPVDVVAAPWRELAGQPSPRLVVAVGAAALEGIRQAGWPFPLLATLLPRAAWKALAPGVGARLQSAVWLDQPMSRQLDLLRTAMPSNARIGVLLGPDSRAIEEELLRAAADRSQSVLVVHAGSITQLPVALQRVLDDTDVLLAVSDAYIFNGSTIQDILSSTFRHRIPLAGFSPAYIKAGAMLALYATPAQIGAQAGEVARGFLAGRPLPAPQGPRDFSIGINYGVARSLGLSIDPDAATKWADFLRAKERSP